DQVTFHAASVTELAGSQEFDCIVSAIPFTSLPPELTRAILERYRNLLKPGGTLTYIEYAWLRHLKQHVAAPETHAQVEAVNRMAVVGFRGGDGSQQRHRNFNGATFDGGGGEEDGFAFTREAHAAAMDAATTIELAAERANRSARACAWTSIGGTVTAADGSAVNGYVVRIVGVDNNVNARLLSGAAPGFGPEAGSMVSRSCTTEARSGRYTIQLFTPDGATAVSDSYTILTQSFCDFNITARDLQRASARPNSRRINAFSEGQYCSSCPSCHLCMPSITWVCELLPLSFP
ncbi:MAG: hypothetical protein HC828_12495, partial [Blastochloris sp.]|nr:hypothetical protein [Blastochloris sp.]